MKWLLLIMLAAPLSGLRLPAQSPAELSGAQFDVVSIKRSPSDAAGGGMRNLPDGTMIVINANAMYSRSSWHAATDGWARSSSRRRSTAVRVRQGRRRLRLLHSIKPTLRGVAAGCSVRVRSCPVVCCSIRS